jgi:hypothetical protein
LGQTRVKTQDLGDGQVTLTDLGALSATGSLITYSNSAHVAFPSGQSGYVLTSNPSNATGLLWTNTPVLSRIYDANGNIQLDFSATANATEYLRIGNTVTGATTSISLAVAGNATDINIRFVPKGNGDLRVGSATVATTTNTLTLTNKTLTDPTISTFVNSNHTHEDAAGGGQLSVNAISAGGTPDGTTFLRGDGQWATPPGSSSDHGTLIGLGDDDHTQYLLANGARPLAGNLDAASFSITGINQVSATGSIIVSGLTVATQTGIETLLNKTLETPVISSFASATHSHENSAGGGGLMAAAITGGTIGTARLGSGGASVTTFLRGDNTWSAPQKGVLSVCFKSENVSAWTNMPAALTLFNGNIGYIAKVELDGYSSGRLLVNRGTAVAVAGSSLMVRYSRSFTTTAASYSPIGTSSTDMIVDVQTASTYDDSGWIRLATDPSTGNIFIALLGISGDNAADPQFGNIYAQFI